MSLIFFSAQTIDERRELVFLVISGLFLGSLTMMNLLGVSRFIDLSFHFMGYSVPMVVPLGVLPYPITFLCTDIISEFYGAKRANLLVLSGLVANLWLFFVMWAAGYLPTVPELMADTLLPDPNSYEFAFFQIRHYALGGMIASMVAYLCAQYLDVYLYHFFRRLTDGKHLWLRNNGSTLVSQGVDTLIVILLTHWLVRAFPIEGGGTWSVLIGIVVSSYLFKALAALLDTLPFYLIVMGLKRYFR